MVFVFEFVYVLDYIDGFPYIKPSLYPWDEAYLVMMDDHFDVFLDPVCEDFIEFFFFFKFVYVVDYVDGFPHIEPSLHPRNKTYLFRMDDCFDVFLDSVIENFIEYFCIDIHKENWSEVLFLCWIFV